MDNYENSFDTLVNYLKMMPKATIKMLNIPRYLLFMKTADQLQKYLAEAMESGEMVIKIDEAFYHGCITVEMEDLTIERPQAFLEILAPASNVEIYPLTNGMLRLSVVFQSVLKPIA